ncbi:hypothetical protein [Alicyclobacillus acidocaldarius]|uniref:Uncharacterized protein n=1 Tax=Alicyclobacillus acidocaldarius subsp. acidocaldarius (strain ATCC 27009 / DSM 446 / BCRC 14685 / JCM 5260 / KCTC 1825 / NBRC 15652 / NCIMB 11725 / NRRL B-14509 / 104-IA) TaxID=521098 RepID=C8WUJ7_ALIAD|nr:hypothetical protein [Alicyclobacillus acidocaldarius]ACV59813.1 hypothetical protein Aaci_2809 [Alicyclobacillus acidocaldarius subsp. acidocaldarius DSM 446]
MMIYDVWAERDGGVEISADGFRPIQDPGKYMEMVTPVARLYGID